MDKTEKNYNDIVTQKIRLYQTYTKKRFMYKIVDGYITYNIDFTDSLSCLCNNNAKLERKKPSSENSYLCPHLMYIFFVFFKLDRNSILNLHRCTDDIKKLISENKSYEEISNHIKKLCSDMVNIECGFCFEDIDLSGRYFSCKYCGKNTHTKCQNLWNKKSRSCIYCKENIE